MADIAWQLDLGTANTPNWTDGLYWASYFAGYAGLVLLLRARVRPFRMSLALDGLLCGLATGALFAALLFAPVLERTQGSGLTVAAAIGYVVGDLFLLCLVGVAFGLTAWRPGRTWSLLGVGLLFTVVADAVYGYLETEGHYALGSLTDPLWPASILATAAAAWQPARRVAARRLGLSLLATPAVFALAALTVLVAGALGHVPVLATALAAAALVCVGVRCGMTFAEHLRLLHRMEEAALTDGLTGLGNRRALAEALDDAVVAAADGEPTTLAFFDLDGFKRYNDTFGHAAGDALLARLGGRLARSVARSGTAYRLGGDEFCVLLRGALDRDTLAVRAASSALVDVGEGFSVSASFGVVALPGDAESATFALQLADERMYADKETRRESPRSQGRDLLLQVLREREPGLEDHVSDVGALSLAVARQLGVPAADLDVIARGAELHDVGKVAIPDKILNKPSALDDLEWQLMRQHTIVGERILATAPALAPVAALVRASHERWDGGGYPDGLEGDRIPLGSRIIAVCDAYDAMLQHRPYAPPMTEADALAELRRCAGSQFDPAVVAALTRVVAQGHTALRVTDAA